MNRRHLIPRGAVYVIVDHLAHTAGRRGRCTCGKEWQKGQSVRRATFAHAVNGFVLRHKLFCCDECVPGEIQSAGRSR